MAITKYNEDGTDYWKVYVHVRSCTNKRKRFQRTIFKLKTEAEARREERKLISIVSKEAQKHDGLGLVWDDVVHLWWKDFQAGYLGRITERSARSYLSIINKWTKTWNDNPAAELTRADGRKILIRMDQQNLSKAYQQKVKNIINKVYEWGIEFGYIQGTTISPFRGLLIEKGEEKAPDILSIEEIKTFLTAAKALDHHWYSIWSFAILTGMRSGELHALSWNQIDLEKDLILVDRSYDSNSKSVGGTKGRYWRTIPINESLKKLIIDLKTSSTVIGTDHVLPRSKDWDNGDQVVPLKNFLHSIGLKRIKFHALRACFATQMLANGVPAPIVMKIGGWKKSSTMDIYLRLAGVDTKGATDCLKFMPNEISFGGNVVNLFGSKDGV